MPRTQMYEGNIRLIFIKQSISTEIVGVHSFHDVQVAARMDQAKLVGTFATEVMADNVMASFVVATERSTQSW